MRDRTGWTRGENGPRKIGRKTYGNLTPFTRPCAVCGEPFSIFVTPKIAIGNADTNNFGLRNCEKHRRSKEAGGPEDDMAGLRMANEIMKQELAGLYARLAELNERLAQYELQPAMAKIAHTNGAAKMPWEL